MSRTILLASDSISESNSSYHLVNVAIRLKKFGFEVKVQFSEIIEGISLNILNSSGIDVSIIGQNLGKLDVLYIWSPRRIQRSLVNYYNFSTLVTHLEDNEWYLARLSENVNDIDSINMVLRKSRLITYVNSNLLELIPRSLATHLMLPGIDDVTFFDMNSTPSEVSSKSGYFLYAGNVTRHVLEGITNIGLAIRKVNKTYGTNYFLFITGIDYTKEVQNRLFDDVLLGNFLRKDLVGKLMRKSVANLQCGSLDIFDKYRFPSKLPEYLISGRPLITENFDLDIQLRDKLNCILVEESSYGAWVTAIEKFISMPDHLVQGIASNAHEIALKELNWESNIRVLSDLLSEL